MSFWIQKKSRAFLKAFTLIEVMVAMVVLAIGLLGLAGMTVVVLRSNLLSQQISDATTLATDLMETLKRKSISELAPTGGEVATSCQASMFPTGTLTSCPMFQQSGLTGQTDFYPHASKSCGVTGVLKNTSSTANYDTAYPTLSGGNSFYSATDTWKNICSQSFSLAQREYIRYYRITYVSSSEVNLAVVVAWKDKFGKWRNIKLSTTKST